MPNWQLFMCSTASSLHSYTVLLIPLHVTFTCCHARFSGGPLCISSGPPPNTFVCHPIFSRMNFFTPFFRYKESLPWLNLECPTSAAVCPGRSPTRHAPPCPTCAAVCPGRSPTRHAPLPRLGQVAGGGRGRSPAKPAQSPASRSGRGVGVCRG